MIVRDVTRSEDEGSGGGRARRQKTQASGTPQEVPGGIEVAGRTTCLRGLKTQ